MRNVIVLAVVWVVITVLTANAKRNIKNNTRDNFVIRCSHFIGLIGLVGVVAFEGMFILFFNDTKQTFIMTEIGGKIVLSIVYLILIITAFLGVYLIYFHAYRIYVQGENIQVKIFYLIPYRKLKFQDIEKVVKTKDETKMYRNGKKIFSYNILHYNTEYFYQKINDYDVPVFYKEGKKLIPREEIEDKNPITYFLKYGKRLEDEEEEKEQENR